MRFLSSDFWKKKRSTHQITKKKQNDWKTRIVVTNVLIFVLLYVICWIGKRGVSEIGNSAFISDRGIELIQRREKTSKNSFNENECFFWLLLYSFTSQSVTHLFPRCCYRLTAVFSHKNQPHFFALQEHVDIPQKKKNVSTWAFLSYGQLNISRVINHLNSKLLVPWRKKQHRSSTWERDCESYSVETPQIQSKSCWEAFFMHKITFRPFFSISHTKIGERKKYIPFQCDFAFVFALHIE